MEDAERELEDIKNHQIRKMLYRNNIAENAKITISANQLASVFHNILEEVFNEFSDREFSDDEMIAIDEMMTKAALDVILNHFDLPSDSVRALIVRFMELRADNT